MREHIEELIFRLKKECGMGKVTLTTNGILLEQQLDGLVKAGLDGVNISLDTLNPRTFEEITMVDALNQVLSSIEKALQAGLQV